MHGSTSVDGTHVIAALVALARLSVLTLLVLLPLPVLIGLAVAGDRLGRALPWLATGTSLAQLLLSLYLIWAAKAGEAGVGLGTFVYQERAHWFSLPGAEGRTLLQVDYLLAADGLSLALLALTGFVLAVAGYLSVGVTHRPITYQALLLLLGIAVPGTFVAQDAFLFYLFFELMLVPMFFLIGIWGGARREFAALQFFIYTLIGSLAILAGLAILYIYGPGQVDSLKALTLEGTISLPVMGTQPIGRVVFWLMALGFMIKLPAVPLHTWLPPAHVEAPTAVSVVLAGVLLKTGGYGLIRWACLLLPAPALTAAPTLVLLGGIGVLYGAMLALASRDFKQLVAYSSISHMGFVLMGVALPGPYGLAGAGFQLVSHGVITAGLFVGAGWLGGRYGTRQLDEIGGLYTVAPRYATLLTALFFAALGLPGMSGFVGEFLVLTAALGQAGRSITWTGPLMALAGLLTTSGYLLWTARRLFMGEPWRRGAGEGTLAPPIQIDLAGGEYALMIVLCALTILLGLMPWPLLSLLTPASAP